MPNNPSKNINHLLENTVRSDLALSLQITIMHYSTYAHKKHSKKKCTFFKSMLNMIFEPTTEKKIYNNIHSTHTDCSTG